MRTTVIAALVALVAGTAAFGQTSTVYIQNQESSDFHYVLDPKELDGLTPGSAQMATKVAGFFAERSDTPSLSRVAAGAEAKIDGLADGTHLLVGFFAVQDQADFPVRVITLQADSRIGERFYAVFASPAQLTVPRGVGRLAGFPLPTPGQAAAAAAPAQPAAQAPQPPQPSASEAAQPAATPSAAAPLPTLVAFSASYAPESFTREASGGLSVLPIADSRSWNRTGTRIETLGAAWDTSGLRLGLTVPSGFADTVSYFFYVFASREEGTANALTIELEPKASGTRGACLLWLKDAQAPRLLGTVTTAGSTAEVDIPAEDLARDFPATGAVSIDLTAALYDKDAGAWEEFYYTTFTSDEITR